MSANRKDRFEEQLRSLQTDISQLSQKLSAAPIQESNASRK